MYSLSISFGPSGTVWAFLFKEEKDAQEAFTVSHACEGQFRIEDDYGQRGVFDSADVHGRLLESLEQIEEARIQRSLFDERCKAKFIQRAKTDPTIRAAMQNQTPVLQPMGGGFP